MVVDTNILLEAVNPAGLRHAAAREALASLRSSPAAWYLTEGILYEFVRVATHPRVFPRPLRGTETALFLGALLDSPRVRVLAGGERHWTLLADALSRDDAALGNHAFDLRTVVLMRENAVRDILSYDRDFDRYPDIVRREP